MLDRSEVKEFLDEEFANLRLKIPKNIPKAKVVETFCRYTEFDYAEWLRDNYKSFFNHGDPDWNWIRDRIKQYESQ
jgi:hypothetical protein